MVLATSEECDTRRGSKGQAKVQMWFRAPKIWDEFLDAKAVEEYCTKADLLRHAFRLAYGRELKNFRVCPQRETEENGRLSLLRVGEANEKGSLPHVTSAMVSSAMEEDPWIESMAAFMANKRSAQTRRAYQLVLNQFFIFAVKHPSDVKQSDVIRYRHYLEQLGKASSTVSQHLAAISGYYNFCVSRDLTVYNPTKGVARPSVHAYTSATWLNKDQAKLLLSQPDRNTVKGRRDYAILLTFLLTGLRRSELAGIRRGDIQERGEKLYLTYICKGGAKIVRDIPLRCWVAIDDYLALSGREITEESPLFTAVTEAGASLRRYYGRDGHNGNHSISPEAIREMVARYSRRAFGAQLLVTPHTLRHTAGTLLRKSGRSIEEVQSFLKHGRIDTTRRYLHVVEASDSDFGEHIARMLNL